jgi:hypothetical protein
MRLDITRHCLDDTDIEGVFCSGCGICSVHWTVHNDGLRIVRGGYLRMNKGVT